MNHLFTFFATFSVFFAFGQACQFLGPDQTLPCGTTSTTLSANFAQCNTAALPKTTATYTATNIPFAPAPTGGTMVFLGDDQTTGALPIGFQFCFYGSTFTSFYICSNGFITFNGGQPSPFNPVAIPSAVFTTPKNAIFGPWQDFNPANGGAIRYQTQGTAPCRRLVVTFTTIPFFGCGGANTFQIILYEGTNVIENHITSKGFCASFGGEAVQGIHNATGTQAVTVPGRNNTVWTANNNAWRYTPNGPVPTPIMTWYEVGNPTPIATNTSTLSVTPPLGGMNYVAVASFSGCEANFAACSGGNGTISDTVFVQPQVNTPAEFSFPTNYCFGANIPALPTTSNNGISGIWSPALNNQQTTTYTFTPNPNECSDVLTVQITIDPQPTPPSVLCYQTASWNSVTCEWQVTGTPPAVAPMDLGPDATICPGQSITLNATPGYDSYLWSNGATTQATTVNQPGTYSVTGTILIPTATNLVTNPGFDQGNTGFSTSYTVGNGGPWGPVSNGATYAITTNPNSAHIHLANCPYQGNMFVANGGGSGNNANVWCQDISIQPNTNYVFSVDAINPHNNAGWGVLPLTLNLVINGNVMGSLTPPQQPNNCNWQTYSSSVWNSGSMTSVTICIQNATNAASLLAIDNISFSPVLECTDTDDITITSINFTTPTFAQVGPYCSGSTIPALPTTSTNNYTGTWAPAINNTQTTTYTFTPTPGQCANNAAMTIAITPQTVPTFAQFGPYCSGSTIPALPTTSNNNITGTWSPAINNTQTTTYTFTPNPGQCAATTTRTIAITSNTLPTFSQVGPYCSGATIPALPTTSLNGVLGTWSPAINNTQTTTYTFTPNAGLCALPTTMTITINPNILPTFAAVGPYCQGAAIPALPTTSQNNFTGTWSPAINNQQTTTYTFTPGVGQCATQATASITITPNVAPTFSQVGPFCTGSTIAPLPTTSTNNVTGTWSPAINNTQTTTYTFTPTAGQCALNATQTITINQLTVPTFPQFGPYCSGATIPALPTTSTNNILGAWSPAINNTATTTYTFTPNPGQCAATTTRTITINPNILPTFAQVGPYCAGANIPALTTTSQNNYTGVWSPAINNNQTTTYTFTPNSGQCATTATMQVTITPNVLPQFNFPTVYCQGDAIAPLPTTSQNNFNGTWSPAVNNQTTTTYTFTPNAGLCALQASAIITINNPTSSITNVSVCQNDLPYLWNGLTLNSAGIQQVMFTDINGCDSTATLNLTVLPVLTSLTNIEVCANQLPFSWNGLNLIETGVHTVTLNSSLGCDSLATINFVVNPLPVVSFTRSIQNGCSPMEVLFTNTSDIQSGSCLWNLGNGVTLASCSQITGFYTDFGCYDVSLQVTSPDGCVGYLNEPDFICVLPKPEASFQIDPVYISMVDPSVQFINTSIGTASQQWNFGGETGTSEEFSPLHIYPDVAGQYTVSLVVANENGCVDSTEMIVVVQNEPIYYVPNTFTPDGDLFNETFKPIFSAGIDIYQYKLLIYNRWGEIIFESNNPEVGWDGTYGGELVSQGMYIYQISYKELTKDKRGVVNGHFNLLR